MDNVTLANLTASLLAGHFIASQGDQIREEVLAAFNQMVRELLPLAERPDGKA